jgi:hydroxymethylbilane synthase
LLSPLNQPDAMTALVAERAFLSELGAGCSVPCGAYARVSGNEVALSGVMLSVDGARSVRAVFHGDEPRELGRSLARHLRDERGGGDFAGWQRTL